LNPPFGVWVQSWLHLLYPGARGGCGRVCTHSEVHEVVRSLMARKRLWGISGPRMISATRSHLDFPGRWQHVFPSPVGMGLGRNLDCVFRVARSLPKKNPLWSGSNGKIVGGGEAPSLEGGVTLRGRSSVRLPARIGLRPPSRSLAPMPEWQPNRHRRFRGFGGWALSPPMCPTRSPVIGSLCWVLASSTPIESFPDPKARAGSTGAPPEGGCPSPVQVTETQFNFAP
jgi:hypothetical protein